jgi:ferritin
LELISEALNSRLNNIVTASFAANRVLDRSMSLLAVKFRLLNCSKLLHEKLAHAFPKIADFVSDFQGSRNMLTIYGVTPVADFDASSHIELFKMWQEEFIKYQDLIEDTIDFAVLDKDTMTKNFLDKYLLDFSPYVETVNNLVDLAVACGDTTLGAQLFDTEVERCITV